MKFTPKTGHHAHRLLESREAERSSPVILSAAKDLFGHRARPFAEFTLSGANVLRVTLCDCSNGQVQFVQIEPCLKKSIAYPEVDVVQDALCFAPFNSISVPCGFAWMALTPGSARSSLITLAKAPWPGTRQISPMTSPSGSDCTLSFSMVTLLREQMS